MLSWTLFRGGMEKPKTNILLAAICVTNCAVYGFRDYEGFFTLSMFTPISKTFNPQIIRSLKPLELPIPTTRAPSLKRSTVPPKLPETLSQKCWAYVLEYTSAAPARKYYFDSSEPLILNAFQSCLHSVQGPPKGPTTGRLFEKALEQGFSCGSAVWGFEAFGKWARFFGFRF